MSVIQPILKRLNFCAFVVVRLVRCVRVMTINFGPHAIKTLWLSGAKLEGTTQFLETVDRFHALIR